MELGKLDRRIIFERALLSRDALGVETDFWAQIGTLWGAVEFAKGGETREANAENSAQSAMFTVRWGAVSKTILTTDRIRWDGRIWDIHARQLIGFNHFITFTAAAAMEGNPR